jgi:hypothetical protein
MCYIFNIFIVSVGDTVSVLFFCTFPVYIYGLCDDAVSSSVETGP